MFSVDGFTVRFVVVFMACGTFKDVFSNPGTEFLLVFPQSFLRNDYAFTEIAFEIFITLDISNGQAMDSAVTLTTNDPRDVISVTVNQSTPGVCLQMPRNRSFPIGNIKGKSYLMHVIATNDVTVMVKNGDLESSNRDSYLAIPTSHLGTAYIALCYSSTEATESASFVVIATGRNPASIKITLPGDSHKTKGIKIELDKVTYVNNDVIFLNLNPFEAYQLQFLHSDVTGTWIESSDVVAVWTGNNRTTFDDLTSKSHILEQIPPTEMAGSQFVACASCNKNPNSVYRVLNVYPNTEVVVHAFRENTKSYTLSRIGTVLELLFDVREEVSFIETSKPSMVYYIHSGVVDGYGDIFSMVIPPLDAPMPSVYSFQLEWHYKSNHSIAIVLEGNTEDITINDQPLTIAKTIYGLNLEHHRITGKPGYVMICLIGHNPKEGTYILRHQNGTPFLAVYEEFMSYEGQGHPLGYGLGFPGIVESDYTEDKNCCVTVDAQGVSLFNDECGTTHDNASSCCILNYQIVNCKATGITKTCRSLDKPRLSSYQLDVVAETQVACHTICADTASCLGVNIDRTVNQTALTPSCQMLFGSTLGYDGNSIQTWQYQACYSAVQFALETVE